jgi:regulator of CtrA degradation
MKPHVGLSQTQMANLATITPRIIEGLYCEALVLSDEVSATFAKSSRVDEAGSEDALARAALSSEALRMTIRMMNALTWLVSHRAHLRGEMSEFQLRRHGRLATEFPGTDPDRLALLAPGNRELISAAERFYARLIRLDHGWRSEPPAKPNETDGLRNRIAVVAI